jgi:hypothetical protein
MHNQGEAGNVVGMSMAERKAAIKMAEKIITTMATERSSTVAEERRKFMAIHMMDITRKNLHTAQRQRSRWRRQTSLLTSSIAIS